MTYGELKTKIKELLEVVVNTPHEGMMYPDTQPILDFLDNNEEIKQLNSTRTVKLQYVNVPEDYAPDILVIGFVENTNDFVSKKGYGLDYGQIIMMIDDFKLEEYVKDTCTDDTTLEEMAMKYAY